MSVCLFFCPASLPPLFNFFEILNQFTASQWKKYKVFWSLRQILLCFQGFKNAPERGRVILFDSSLLLMHLLNFLKFARNVKTIVINIICIHIKLVFGPLMYQRWTIVISGACPSFRLFNLLSDKLSLFFFWNLALSCISIGRFAS